MDSYQVALITAFVVLLQCYSLQGVNCSNRKTTIQIKISGKTNVNLKFPTKTDPVKFVPYPYDEGKGTGTCFICNDPECRKCAKNEYQSPSSPSSVNTQRTNIIIDLKRDKSQETDGSKTNNNGNKDTSSTTDKDNQSSGGASQQDGTVVVVQDSSSAFSASDSSATVDNSKGDQTADSSASSVAVTNTDVIASFDPNNSDGKSKGGTEDIYVVDDSKSNAGSSASSDVKPSPANANATDAKNT